MKFMDKLAAGLEKFLMPVASAIGGQRHLGALRDGFISTLPISMTGAIGTLMLNTFLKPDSLVGRELMKIESYKGFYESTVSKYVNPVFNQMWWGTLAMTSLFIVLTISYSLAKSYEVDAMAASLVALGAYMALIPDAQGGLFAFNAEKKIYEGTGWGLLSWANFNSTAMFTAMIVGLIATQIYVWIVKRGWTIKMPEQVPPAVSRAFTSVIPAMLTIFIFGLIFVIFQVTVQKDVKSWIEVTIQKPMMSFGQSPAVYIVLILISQLLWFFGLHGMNMVEPALNAMYGPALNQNNELVTNGQAPVNLLTRNFVDVYAMPGGSGGTLALIIALFIFSKKQESRELAKLAVAPGIFQINEPVIFGLPLVLNPIYFIPFVCIPPIMMALAYAAHQVLPIAYLSQITPWVTPPVLSAFLGTNGDWLSAVLAAVLFILAIVLWAPFVIAANKIGEDNA